MYMYMYILQIHYNFLKRSYDQAWGWIQFPAPQKQPTNKKKPKFKKRTNKQKTLIIKCIHVMANYLQRKVLATTISHKSKLRHQHM